MRSDEPPFNGQNPHARIHRMRFAMPDTLLGRIVALCATLLFIGLAFAFSLVLLVVAAVLGLLFWIYIQWRLFAARRAMKQQDVWGRDAGREEQPGFVGRDAPRQRTHTQAAGSSSDRRGEGRIIEGEVLRNPKPTDDKPA